MFLLVFDAISKAFIWRERCCIYSRMLADITVALLQPGGRYFLSSASISSSPLPYFSWISLTRLYVSAILRGLLAPFLPPWPSLMMSSTSSKTSRGSCLKFF